MIEGGTAPKRSGRAQAAALPGRAEILGHDLRSAIATIVTASDLLLRGALDQRQRLYVSTARDAANTALQLIAELDAGAGSGELRLAPQPLDLQAFVDGLEQSLSVQAAAKGIGAEVQREGLPPRVLGDAVRLRQIVENLVSNAVRVTSSGSVDLRVSASPPSHDGAVALRFQVEDSGPGVPAGQEEAIFAPRTQGDAATRGSGGLGLWIARDLARRMGGDMTVARARGGGALFAVTVRATLLPNEFSNLAGADRPARVASLSSPCVLVVDDAAINRTLIASLLEGFGFAFELAASGPEAIAALLRRPFGLVLLDLHMPGMDGFQTLARIRALPGRGGLPVVAVTARDAPGEQARLVAGGFDAYLAKPIEARPLYRTIMDLAAESTAEGDV